MQKVKLDRIDRQILRDLQDNKRKIAEEKQKRKVKAIKVVLKLLIDRFIMSDQY